MSLLAMLTQSPVDKVPRLSGEWRQFVLDHLSYLATTSQRYDIVPELMNLYRFDLVRFLVEKLQRRQQMAEIVLLLNNMNNDFEFSEPGEYIIPSDSDVEKLYSSYLTIDANQF